MHRNLMLGGLMLAAFSMIAACTGIPSSETPPQPTATASTEEPSTSVSLDSTAHPADGCEALYPAPIDQQQVGYRGILPGITTASEVEAQVGPSPDIYRDSGDQDENLDEAWFYDHFEIYLKQGFVTYIAVPMFEEDVSLDEVFTQYGCPDIILAIDINEGPMSHYNSLEFYYLNLGFEIQTFVFPAILEDHVANAAYFPTSTISAFSADFYRHYEPERSIIVPWEDAISEDFKRK